MIEQINFRVGQQRKTRGGRLVTITKIDNDPRYPINSGDGSYTLEGLEWSGDTSSGDLVKLVSDPSAMQGLLTSLPAKTRTFRQDLTLAALQALAGVVSEAALVDRISDVVDQLDAKYGDTTEA